MTIFKTSGKIPFLLDSLNRYFGYGKMPNRADLLLASPLLNRGTFSRRVLLSRSSGILKNWAWPNQYLQTIGRNLEHKTAKRLFENIRDFWICFISFTSNCHSNIEERIWPSDTFRKFIFHFFTCLQHYRKNKARSMESFELAVIFLPCFSHNNLNRHSNIIQILYYLNYIWPFFLN